MREYEPNYPDGQDIRKEESQGDQAAEAAREKSGLRITRDVEWETDETAEEHNEKQRKSS